MRAVWQLMRLPGEVSSHTNNFVKWSGREVWHAVGTTEIARNLQAILPRRNELAKMFMRHFNKLAHIPVVEEILIPKQQFQRSSVVGNYTACAVFRRDPPITTIGRTDYHISEVVFGNNFFGIDSDPAPSARDFIDQWHTA